jgi:uncharacterized membrane protein HdeD (DUF308 family)
MSVDSSIDRSAVTGVRTALVVGGALSVVIGILILVWPGKTAMVVTAIVAIYTILAGLLYGGLGLFGTRREGWSRIGHILLGALFVIAGIVAFVNLGATTAWLAVFLGVLVGILWIVEGVVSLSTLGSTPQRIWTFVFAVLSIVAGITLLLSPLWGAAVLWWLLGISAIVLGLTQVVRAVSFGR